MRATFKLDPSRFYRASRKLAGLARSKPVQDVMRSAAGQVIRTVVDVTPPAKGKADKSAQARGEAAIAADVAKLAIPVTVQGASRRQASTLVASVAEFMAVYEKARVNSSGRVNPRNRKEKLFMDQRDYLKVLRDLMKLVGLLASGWAAAAEALGVRLPAWIRRHGTKHGVVKITVRPNGIRIFFGNDVNFVDNIPDLGRRLQWALDTVAKSIIEKQIPAAVARVARSAGFKVR